MINRTKTEKLNISQQRFVVLKKATVKPVCAKRPIPWQGLWCMFSTLAGFGRTQLEYSVWYWSPHLKEDIDYSETQEEFSKDDQKTVEEMYSFSIKIDKPKRRRVSKYQINKTLWQDTSLSPCPLVETNNREKNRFNLRRRL